MEVEIERNTVDYSTRLPWQKKLDRVIYKDVNTTDLDDFARRLREHDRTAEVTVNGGLLIQGNFRTDAEYGAFIAGIEFAHLIATRRIRTYVGDAPRDD
jgi:hypothetical protein